MSFLDEKKGKDLTGDGKVDSDDYLAARDAAIKKAKSMKELKNENEKFNVIVKDTGKIIDDGLPKDLALRLAAKKNGWVIQKAGESINESLEALMSKAKKIQSFVDKQGKEDGYEGGAHSPVGGVLAALKVAGGPGFDGDEKLKGFYTRKLSKAIDTQLQKKYMKGFLNEFDDKSMKEGVAKDLYIKAMESSSLEEFLSDVYQDYPQHKGNSDIADYLKNYYLDAGGPLNEGSLKSLLVALGIGAASVGLLKKLDASDPVVKAIKTAQEKGLVDTPAEKKAAKDMLLRRGVWLDTGRGEGGDITVANVNKALKEAKTIELPSDTTFTVDLKHLMKKHMAEGKSKEEVIVFTKKLMAKLHDKGELTVDGTKIVFKEGKKKSGYMGYTELAEVKRHSDDLVKKVMRKYEHPTIGVIANLEDKIESSKKKKEEFEDARDSKGIDNYRYYEKIIPKYEELIRIVKHHVERMPGGIDLKFHVDKISDQAKDLYPQKLVPFWTEFEEFEEKETRASDGRMRDLERERNREAGNLGENKTNEASFMGAPLETFSDYYDALSVAAEIGVAAAVAIVILAKLGIAKGKQLFAQGKEAVMNWYEQNKLNEQEDTQLALPEPDAQDFLGDDGMDYEGGMAKSQMLKMKKYAMALCDMIDDESQLESWVQAKLTKASDYMSSVYHYLDYQESKMNETFELNGRKVVDLEADGQYINKAYYLDTDKELNDNELDALINKYPADLEFGGEWWEQRR